MGRIYLCCIPHNSLISWGGHRHLGLTTQVVPVVSEIPPPNRTKAMRAGKAQLVGDENQLMGRGMRPPKKPRGRWPPCAHHPCCVLAWAGGDQEGLRFCLSGWTKRHIAATRSVETVRHQPLAKATACLKTVEASRSTRSALLLIFQCLIPIPTMRATGLTEGLLLSRWSVTTTLQRSSPTSRGQSWLPSSL